MSGTGTGSFNVGSSTLYRYPIIAALSIVLVIGGMLCWRSRVIERRARLLRPPITVAVRAPGSGEMLLVDIAKAKPRFYDVYLQLAKMEGERERVWCEIMVCRVFLVSPLARRYGAMRLMRFRASRYPKYNPPASSVEPRPTEPWTHSSLRYRQSR
ncbi:hypothetical protein C8R46DRAFT_437196 [Mycena filopes]|nr:hypothetical protein C8R46DRAFT_437196 [Mycena filopes]